MTADPDFVRTLRREARAEAERLLHWWGANIADDADGFHGEIGSDDKPVPAAPRSAILYTRLLWFFSAMGAHLKSDEALVLARRAADYLSNRFIDPDHGGLYWMLDARGQVIDARKHAYVQAFGVYAFAEHARVTNDKDSLKLARDLQREIEERFWDHQRGGYIEAMSAFWHEPGDQRLSDKDADCPKTMNTHLHILEAYTGLHRAAPTERTHAALHRALGVFIDRFVDPQSGQLRLFYTMDWSDQTHAVSFGHDIEASWLIWEAALVLNDREMQARVKPLSLALAMATLAEGRNAHGGLSYERKFPDADGRDHLDPAGEWWGQAEGLVGLVNAWQLNGDPLYLDAAEQLWAHLKAQFGAGQGHEWTWYARNSGHQPMVKAGQWKCPYHNGRAMIELDQRLKGARG
jgi:mannobiose 2-epimerase